MSPRAVVLLVGALVALVAGLLFGTVAFASGNRPVGLLFLIGTPISAVANGVMISVSRRRNRPGPPPRRAPATGHVLAPASMPARQGLDPVLSSPGQRQTWTGGGNVAGPMGRTNATYPLAVLTTAPGVAELRLRPRMLARLFGLSAITWRPDQVIVAYPVRGRLVSFKCGVAVESATHALAYFWTSNPVGVLVALQQDGFTVEWSERQIKLFP